MHCTSHRIVLATSSALEQSSSRAIRSLWLSCPHGVTNVSRQCQLRGLRTIRNRVDLSTRCSGSRHFHSAATHRQNEGSPASRRSQSSPRIDNVILASTSVTLPSYTAKQRSAISERVSRLTDSILARASIAGQHINTYTGTDYSAIEALRNEIVGRETEVKTRHAAVGEAKTAHTDARVKQATSQKEIVGLLERKSSWGPADLERYMALVRSEHIHDQAVQRAAEELAAAERELESTRSLLERLERKQYHEEQIWSDTIRRNSTWVTIGLMGVNILLLLAQISIFEPYRRRKIVKQIKEVLDEKSPDTLTPDAVAREIDAIIEPQGVLLEQIEVSPTMEHAEPNMSESQPAVVADVPTLIQDAASRVEGFFAQAAAKTRHWFHDQADNPPQFELAVLRAYTALSVAAGMLWILRASMSRTG